MKISGEVGHFEVDLDVLLAVGKIKQFKGLQRFPTITRDISVLIPVRVSWQEIQDGLPHQQVAFINDYYGSEIEAGFKVVTLRLVVSHPDRTPTDLDANQQETKILTLLARAFGAQRRQVT
jgi:phenylalanyl-tRNA synthetase beta subunit